MFDTMHVAQTIRSARIRKNMTQMTLADEMGVRYQAVSNWERGNSMPDIAKLESLCGLLDLTIDELLGKDDPQTKTVKKMIQQQVPTLDEFAPIASILPPKQAHDFTIKSAEAHPVALEQLISLAPFLDRETLDTLAMRVEKTGDLGELLSLAPFLSKDTLSNILDDHIDDPDPSALMALAPFLSQEKTDALFCEAYQKMDTSLLCGIAPFVSEHVLSEAVLELLRSGRDCDTGVICGLFPFLSSEARAEAMRRTMNL